MLHLFVYCRFVTMQVAWNWCPQIPINLFVSVNGSKQNVQTSHGIALWVFVFFLTISIDVTSDTFIPLFGILLWSSTKYVYTSLCVGAETDDFCMQDRLLWPLLPHFEQHLDILYFRRVTALLKNRPLLFIVIINYMTVSIFFPLFIRNFSYDAVYISNL